METKQTFEKRLPHYIIRKLISYPEKTSRLCNSEANHAYEKKSFRFTESES